MKKIFFLLGLSIILLVLANNFPKHYFSSAPECISDTQDDLNSKNQQILIAILKGKSPKDYRYFFKTFLEEGQDTYMITNFRNTESCFDVKVLVDKWNRLSGMKKTNGRAYPKELYNLKWEIIYTDSQAIVKYLDMHKIID